MRTATQIIDGIVAQNEALWTFLTKGDDLSRAERLELIDKAFPSNRNHETEDSERE